MKAVQKQVTILERKLIIRTGVILYTLLSSDGISKYFATVKDGKCFCECKGFGFGKCYHSDFINVIESLGVKLVAECVGYSVYKIGETLVEISKPSDWTAAVAEIQAERKMAAYLNTYDDMAAEKTASIEAVREQQTKVCDRCHKDTDEYRIQDGEVLCERCIRELERNAGMEHQQTREVDAMGYRSEWYP